MLKCLEVKGHDVCNLLSGARRQKRRCNLLEQLPRPWKNLMSRFTGSKGFLVGTQLTVAESGISYLLGGASLA